MAGRKQISSEEFLGKVLQAKKLGHDAKWVAQELGYPNDNNVKVRCSQLRKMGLDVPHLGGSGRKKVDYAALARQIKEFEQEQQQQDAA